MQVKNEERPKTDIGVIVGRFQVHTLRDAQKELIQSVIDNHGSVIVVLGLSPVVASYNNPLDYAARRKMIQQEFPDVEVLYVTDQPSNVDWSNKLDSVISNVAGSRSACIYGTKAGVIDKYTGNLRAYVLESDQLISDKLERNLIRVRGEGTEDFRKGVIWAASNQYPTFHPVADILPYRVDEDGSVRILLGRKNSDPGGLYRMFGGFCDVEKDSSLESAAKRELKEETGIDATDKLEYVTSFVVNDWRYKSERNKIMSSVFIVKMLWGSVSPNDDIDELRWFPLDKIRYEQVISEHRIAFSRAHERICNTTAVN